jgi:YegS/Rv2252/BmrU family lipid kinase
MPLESGKTTFIVNPNSANGATGREWPRLSSTASERLGTIETRMTTGPEHATVLTREALGSGSEIVVCVGGDGTLNEVVNGFIDEGGVAPEGALLGFIPRGTGCDFVKSISIPCEPDKAMSSILNRRSRLIDLGRMTYRTPAGGTSCRYFHNLVSFGLGGEVDDRVNRTTKVFGGFISFIWATVISILRYDRKLIRLCVDDVFDREVSAWNVAVANGRYFGGGMLVAPGAEPDDGLFQVTVVGDLNLMQVFLNLHNLYNGKVYDVDKVTGLTGKRIRADSPQRVLIDMDGEQPGELPAEIEVVPSALRIICDE